MPRSDAAATPATHRSIDWRGWLALAWALWFGLLYGQMVVARRGAKFQAMFHSAAAHSQTQRDQPH